MEKQLQDLVDQLGSAIDEAIAGSDRIGAIVHEMEQAGYDLTLVLEATMRLSPKDTPVDNGWPQSESDLAVPVLTASGKFDLTPQDQQFLEELKIAI
jgi:hypothetical protein